MFRKIINLRRVPTAPSGKLVKEAEIMGLLSHVKQEINSINLDIDQMSEEAFAIEALRLDAMEKSYYILFNKLRAIRGFDSFETVAERLKESYNYEELNERYKLDQIGKNCKFLSGYDYNHSSVFHFNESN
jgi:hypothetical protein